jgi:Holliday junction resolvase
MDKTKFYAYRFFIIPYEQISFYTNNTKPKEKLIIDFFEKLQHDPKYIFMMGDKKHIVYYNKKVREDIHICKLAKQSFQKTPREGDRDIEEAALEVCPFVKIIVDVKKQKILVEKKTSVFSRPGQIEKTLQNWFNAVTINDGYEFKVEAITDEKDFWNKVDNAQYIYSLEIKLNAPNLFGGKAKASEFIQEAKNEYNNTSVNIKLENDKGFLKLGKEKIKSFIEYATAGGGNWILRTKTSKNSPMQTTKSQSKIRMVSIPENIDNLEDEEVTEQLYQILEDVETMMVDDDSETC